jgi:cation diffusion facilitator family transporter
MPNDQSKGRAAALSVASNAALILAKLIAGIATGSVAILTEAVHSCIDLLASLVALVSVRKAGEPADAEHLYGHDKMENLAAATEGALILLGAAIITYEAITRLVHGAHVHTIGVGIAVIAASAVVNLVVSRIIDRRARETASVALAGDATHLSADAFSSLAVLLGLVLIAITHDYWIDPVVALLVAGGIVIAGGRLLRRASRALVGFHKLRSRSAGSRRYIDLHLQFADGTTLEEAHGAAHALTDEIAQRLDGADVLIHIEPGASVKPGS